MPDDNLASFQYETLIRFFNLNKEIFFDTEESYSTLSQHAAFYLNLKNK